MRVEAKGGGGEKWRLVWEGTNGAAGVGMCGGGKMGVQLKWARYPRLVI
jgi:hypothetical protein